MAERIVPEFEPIRIDEQERDVRAFAQGWMAALFDHGAQALSKSGGAEQAGQLIDLRFSFDVVRELRPKQSIRRETRDQFGRAPLFIGERLVAFTLGI